MSDFKTVHRIEEFDIARGIAILLVVVGHALPVGSYGRIFIYSFHIPLFFVLAGLTMKDSGSSDRLLMRVLAEKKLIAVYVYFTVIYLAYDLISRVGFQGFELDFIGWDLYQTVVLYGINVLWFVSSLFLARQFVRFIRMKVKNMKIQVLLVALILIVCCAVSSVLNRTAEMLWLNYLCVSFIRAVYAAGFVLVGVLLRDHLLTWISHVGSGCCIACAVVSLAINITCCTCAGQADMHRMELGVWWLNLVISFTGTVSVICFSTVIKKCEWLKRGLCFFGVNSLFIMLTHEYLQIKKLLNLFLNTVLMIEYESMVHIVLQTLILIAIEIVLCLTIKKYYDKVIGIVESKMEKHLTVGWKRDEL